VQGPVPGKGLAGRDGTSPPPLRSAQPERISFLAALAFEARSWLE
jgi:hypothetical protein